MPIMIQWNEITTSNLMPDGFYNLKIEQAEITHNNKGILQINMRFTVTEPKAFYGRTIYDFLQLGKDAYKTIEPHWPDDYKEYALIDDPNMEDKRVRAKSQGLKRFKHILNCTGYTFPMESALEEVCVLARGRKVTALIGTEVAKWGKRKGQDQNTISDYVAYGSEDPELQSEAKKPSSVAKPNAPAMVTPIRPKMPTGIPEPVWSFDDEDDPSN